MNKVREMLWGESNWKWTRKFSKNPLQICICLNTQRTPIFNLCLSLSLSHASAFRLAQNQSWMSLSVINLTGIWRDVWSSYTKFKDGGDHCINVSPCLPPSWWLLCSGNKIVVVVLEERLKNPSHNKFLFWIFFSIHSSFFNVGEFFGGVGTWHLWNRKCQPSWSGWSTCLLYTTAFDSFRKYNILLTRFSIVILLVGARALQMLEPCKACPWIPGSKKLGCWCSWQLGIASYPIFVFAAFDGNQPVNKEGRSTNKINSIV